MMPKRKQNTRCIANAAGYFDISNVTQREKNKGTISKGYSDQFWGNESENVTAKRRRYGNIDRFVYSPTFYKINDADSCQRNNDYNEVRCKNENPQPSGPDRCRNFVQTCVGNELLHDLSTKNSVCDTTKDKMQKALAYFRVGNATCIRRCMLMAGFEPNETEESNENYINFLSASLQLETHRLNRIWTLLRHQRSNANIFYHESNKPTNLNNVNKSRVPSADEKYGKSMVASQKIDKVAPLTGNSHSRESESHVWWCLPCSEEVGEQGNYHERKQ